MREILFRGKRVDNDEWIQGYLHKTDGVGKGYRAFAIQVQDIDSYMCRPHSHEVQPKTVGQFTGLTDKNGKKIFEGDIVAYNTLFIDGKEIQEIGYFEYDEHYVSFRIHGTQMTPFHCEVIGNVHDNKDLLGENK